MVFTYKTHDNLTGTNMEYKIVLKYTDGRIESYVKLSQSEAESKVDVLYKAYGNTIESCDIYSSEIVETPVEYTSIWEQPEFRQLMILPKESLALKLIENSETNIHLEQLIAFLEALEFEHIDDLLLQDVEYFIRLGEHLKHHLEMVNNHMKNEANKL